MTTESLLQFLIDNNVQMIQWSVAAIVILSTISLFWMVFRQPKESSTLVSENRSRLLDESWTNTNQATSKEPSAAQSGPLFNGQPESSDENKSEAAKTTSQKDDAARPEGSATVQQNVAAGENSETASLRRRLKSSELLIVDLESKLKEYEILEDDIADLSRYREENEKLKAKLSELNASIDESAPSASTTKSQEALGETESTLATNQAEDVLQDEDLLAEFQKALDEQNSKTDEKLKELKSVDIEQDLSDQQSEAITDPAASEITEPDLESVSPEFASSDLGSVSSENTAPEPEAGLSEITEQISTEETQSFPSETKPSVVDAAIVEASTEFANDLLAEFSQAPESESGQEPATNLLDTEKMLEEMSALTGVDSISEEVLAEELDTNKMAEEASQLEKQKEVE